MIININSITQDDHFITYIGNKSVGLLKLLSIGENIPLTYILPLNSELTDEDINILREAFKEKQLILRSSSFVEDSDCFSAAGMFLSLKTDFEIIKKTVETIRIQAENITKNDKIPLIIQEYIEGIGGVYLANPTLEKESLQISFLGVSSVTSGMANNFNYLDSKSKIYQSILKQCRKIVKTVNYPVDLEFVVNNNHIYFLQMRRFIYKPDSNNSNCNSIQNKNISSSLPSNFSEYLSPLCGTLWSSCLSKILKTSYVYDKGYIHDDLPTDTEEQNLDQQYDLKDDDYLKAINFYKKSLFPHWEDKLEYLKSIINTEKNYRELFKKVYDCWFNFMQDYLDNDFEYIIDYARETGKEGIGLSPFLCEWLNDLKGLEPNDFIAKYGLMFNNEVNFQEPALCEMPETVALMKANYSNSLVFPVETPSLIIQAAWLAEEDNKYKHFFNFYLRKSIILLGGFLRKINLIKNINDVWNFSLKELLRIIDIENLTEDTEIYFDKLSGFQKQHSGLSNTILQPLSPGLMNGFVVKDTGSSPENKILVKHSLNNFDYPFFFECSGAIVAFSSYNSHIALLARDINKPLYKSLIAVENLKQDDYIEVNNNGVLKKNDAT
jgi:hypothetical protein